MMAETQQLPWYAAYVSGSVAGLLSGVVGHPFDSLKLRMQTEGLSLMEASSQAAVRPLGLFRGLSYGLGVQIAVGSMLFGVYDNVQAFLPRDWHPSLRSSVAGTLTGLTLSPLTCLLEAHKCRAQSSQLMTMTAPRQWGLLATALRCSAGNSAYFAIFEALSSSPALVGGTAAGVAFWTIALPFDVVKSHQQVGTSTGSFWATLRSLPPRRLWAGWLPAVLRAAPMTVVCFFAYRYTHNALEAFFFHSSSDLARRRRLQGRRGAEEEEEEEARASFPSSTWRCCPPYASSSDVLSVWWPSSLH